MHPYLIKTTKHIESSGDEVVDDLRLQPHTRSTKKIIIRPRLSTSTMTPAITPRTLYKLQIRVVRLTTTTIRIPLLRIKRKSPLLSIKPRSSKKYRLVCLK